MGENLNQISKEPWDIIAIYCNPVDAGTGSMFADGPDFFSTKQFPFPLYTDKIKLGVVIKEIKI